MPNFYTDNDDILFQLEHLDLRRIVELKEDDFSEKATYPWAPTDHDDCVDSYKRVLDIVGDIAGNFIEPRAHDVDREGAQYADGEVRYARGTTEALDRMAKAGLMGFTLPRQYGGLNLPKIMYSAAIEMVARADAGIMNLFGLQDIAETVLHFGSQDQKDRFLPRFASGEASGAMDLTEPDAGSDLQAVMLRAHEDGDGSWRLNGVKRFITNGCADLHLVLARSEEGTTSGTGLSLFIFDRAAGGFRVRRIEDKLGIHASPTCEIQFTEAPAELLGRRKYGLIKYTMSLMNGARLGIAAQAVGIAEAAMREARSYAAVRSQFRKTIDQFSPVKEMLTDMRVAIEGGRTLLYETSRIVDIKEGIEERIEHHPETKRDLSGDLKRYTRLAALFTPICKAYTTEMANKVAYDAIQVHGGVGFTREFNVERHYRDARITNIYEGTTQLQVVAAIGGVVGGLMSEYLQELSEQHDLSGPEYELAKSLRDFLESALGFIKGREDAAACQDYHARRLVDLAGDAAIAHLLCADATKGDSDAKRGTTRLFALKAQARAKATIEYMHACPNCPE